MGLFLENCKMALSSIKSNKMRSFLTMLGIIIGIASVITITSVGASTKENMNGFLSSFGENRIILYMDFDVDDSPSENQFFSEDDVEFLEQKFNKELSYISVYQSYNKKIKKERNEADVRLLKVNYNYNKELSKNHIIYGRDFLKSDITKRRNVVIVDQEFGEKLFKKKNVVGESFYVDFDGDVKNFTIIGVYEKEKTIFDNISMGDSTEAFIPYTINSEIASLLDFKISNGENLKNESNAILKFITRYKKAKEGFYKINSLEEQSAMINKMLSTLSIGIGAIAAISLIVGGIGIMNIMLVSVTERTKEIGIRKSLGAMKKDILIQFLIESMILSGLGGLIGTLLGLSLSTFFVKLMNIKPVIKISSILISVGFSILVGVAFGLYPANKAAKLNPIDALRYE